MKLQSLRPRVSQLEQRGAQEKRKWDKGKLGAIREITGRARQKRAERLKLAARFRCQVCNQLSHHLEIDHIIPLAQGGSEDDSNLQVICAGKDSCHEAKTILESRHQPSDRESTLIFKQRRTRIF